MCHLKACFNFIEQNIRRNQYCRTVETWPNTFGILWGTAFRVNMSQHNVNTRVYGDAIHHRLAPYLPYISIIHRDGNVGTLMEFSSLSASEVIILTTLGAASGKTFVKKTAFSCQCTPFCCLQRLAWTDVATALVGRPGLKPTTSWTVLTSVVAPWPMSAWGAGIISAYRKSHHRLAYHKTGNEPYLFQVISMV